MTISCSFCTKLTEGDYHSVRLHTMAIASCFILEKHAYGSRARFNKFYELVVSIAACVGSNHEIHCTRHLSPSTLSPAFRKQKSV